MKTSTLLTSLCLALSVSAAPQFGRNRGGFGGNKGGNNGGNNNNNANNGAAASNGTAAANNGTNNAATGNNGTNNAAAGNNAGGNNGGGDAQTSLTLDPAVIASGFANNGQDVPAAGQVASLTSTNNFINFCLTVNAPITNGKQITTGSCNPAPIGTIPSVDNMPSSKFVSPTNGDTVVPNQAFTVSMAVKNLVTGNFVNAQENYFAAPQQLDGSGQIVGHTHVTIETLTDLAQTTPTNPKQFAYFKGVNGAAVNGVVTADITDGLPAGVYRMCSINAAANHQPVIVPIAQHGSLDDCVYFTAANGGATGAASGAANSTQATGAQASGTQAAATQASGAQNNGGQNKGQNNGQNGKFGQNKGQNGGRRRSAQL